MIESGKIDFNANDDIMHIVYMLDVDMFVSNDERFMKTAFCELCKDKQILTFSEFLTIINKL